MGAGLAGGEFAQGLHLAPRGRAGQGRGDQGAVRQDLRGAQVQLAGQLLAGRPQLAQHGQRPGGMDNNLEKPQELVSQMVFAEQRLLAMCAKIKDKKIESFVELDNLFCQESFTHIWGYKKDLAADYVAENLFCTKIVDRLLNDFKDLSNLLLNIPVVRKYM